jgi:AraC-like DNA-binding protein
MKHALREITPLVKDDIFFTTYYPDNQMDFPLHFHEDFELCLTLHAKGKRTVGNLIDDFTPKDLILVGPNILHCYKRDEEMDAKPCDVYIVQFSKDLHLLPIFNTNRLRHIKNLLTKAVNGGIKFSEDTVDFFTERIKKLNELKDFEQFIYFLELLNDLATSNHQEYLSLSVKKGGHDIMYSISQSRRINRIIQFVEMNYRNKILLTDIGRLVGMSTSSVSRFFKKKTNYNFSDFLNNYRVDCAAKMLIETELFISEICYSSGFDNISNFNRAFKKHLNCTPNEYRLKYKSAVIPHKWGE